MFKKILLGVVISLALLLPLALPAIAQTSSEPITFVDTSASKYDEGNYNLDDMVMILVRASSWILGIVGSLALLMFIYGGFMFLISAGSSEKIGKAKTILIAAVIGLAIVFGSYLIIKFFLQTLGIENWNGTPMKVSKIQIENTVNKIMS